MMNGMFFLNNDFTSLLDVLYVSYLEITVPVGWALNTNN